MFIAIIITIFGFIVTFSSLSIIIWKTLKDRKQRKKDFMKTILKITAILTNILLVVFAITLSFLTSDYKESLEEKASERNSYYDSEYIDDRVGSFVENKTKFIPVIIAFDILCTFAFLFYKEKRPLYIAGKSNDQSTNICNYCPMNQLNISPNSPIENEVIELLRQKPETAETILKILK